MAKRTFTDTLNANRAGMSIEEKLDQLKTKRNYLDNQIHELMRKRELCLNEIERLEKEV